MSVTCQVTKDHIHCFVQILETTPNFLPNIFEYFVPLEYLRETVIIQSESERIFDKISKFVISARFSKLLCLLYYDYYQWRSKGQADKRHCGLNFLPSCLIDCSKTSQGMDIYLQLYVRFIFYRRQAYSDLASKNYKCLKDSVIQNLIMNLNKPKNPVF